MYSSFTLFIFLTVRLPYLPHECFFRYLESEIMTMNIMLFSNETNAWRNTQIY